MSFMNGYPASPFQRQNGLQPGQMGAAGAGQYSAPAGVVTPPMTAPGGGAGMQAMQAPAVQPQQRQGGTGVGGTVGQIGGLLGLLNGSGQLTPGQNKALGGAGLGAEVGSMFGPVGAIAGGIGGGLMGALGGK